MWLIFAILESFLLINGFYTEAGLVAFAYVMILMVFPSSSRMVSNWDKYHDERYEGTLRPAPVPVRPVHQLEELPDNVISLDKYR